MIDKDAWDRAVEVLGGASEVVVACHVDPDGDALGSLLGLGGFLRRSGKRVFLTWGTPGPSVPPRYAFLPVGVGSWAKKVMLDARSRITIP